MSMAQVEWLYFIILTESKNGKLIKTTYSKLFRTLKETVSVLIEDVDTVFSLSQEDKEKLFEAVIQQKIFVFKRNNYETVQYDPKENKICIICRDSKEHNMTLCDTYIWGERSYPYSLSDLRGKSINSN
jgi:hypothetical protein